jgi:hypothetical protein
MQTPAEPVLGPSLPVSANWQRLGGYAQLTSLHWMLFASHYSNAFLREAFDYATSFVRLSKFLFFCWHSGADATLMQHRPLKLGTPYA